MCKDRGGRKVIRQVGIGMRQENYKFINDASFGLYLQDATWKLSHKN
jgi:hypothetical protein